MGKKAPKPPPAPDPVAIARAEAEANRIDQFTPFGNVTFGPRGGGGGQTIIGPNGQPIFVPSGGGGTGRDAMTMEFSPEIQRQFDLQNQITEGSLMQAMQRQSALPGPFVFDGPARQNSVQSQYFGSVRTPEGDVPVSQGGPLKARDAQPTPAAGRPPALAYNVDFGEIPTTQLGTDVGFGNLPELNTDFGPETQRVSDALFQRGQRLLDPVFERERNRREQQLANQGLPVGSEAFASDFGDMRNRQNEAFTNLALDSVLAGSNEQGRLFNQSLAARGQMAGESATQAGFRNQALMSQFGVDSAGRQQSVQDQLMANELQNNARNMMFNEQVAERGLNFNEMAALLGHQQVATPQLGNFVAPGQVDVVGANQMANNAQMQAFQAQMGSRNSMFGALGDLGGSLAMAYALSDRRLKRNIRRVGETDGGLAMYSYNFPWSDKTEVGVMADEVERVIPNAVITGDDGYKRVNYWMVR